MSTWTEDQVEGALRAHHRTRDEGDVLLLELVALVHAGAANEEETKRAAEALRTQPELAETVLVLRSIDAREKRAVPLQKVIAVAAAIAALIALLILFPWKKEPLGELSPKGGPDELALAVEREGRRFAAQPGDLLQKGDRLGMFYSTDSAGYLAIIHRDRSGEVTALFPAHKKESAPIAAGNVDADRTYRRPAPPPRDHLSLWLSRFQIREHRAEEERQSRGGE